MEKILLSFLFCGAICLIAQIILDNTKLTAGHITSIFVVKVGGGAMVPITSFGHQLIHGGLHQAEGAGVFGLVMGMFDLTASGISAAIIFSFFLTLIFKPRN